MGMNFKTGEQVKDHKVGMWLEFWRLWNWRGKTDEVFLNEMWRTEVSRLGGSIIEFRNVWFRIKCLFFQHAKTEIMSNKVSMQQIWSLPLLTWLETGNSRRRQSLVVIGSLYFQGFTYSNSTRTNLTIGHHSNVFTTGI